MLPVRKSEPVRRAAAIGAEIRVPTLGLAFVAHARTISAESVRLATFQTLAEETPVVVELALRTGTVVVEGVVCEDDDDDGVLVRFVDVDTTTRLLLDAEAAPSSRPDRAALDRLLASIAKVA